MTTLTRFRLLFLALFTSMTIVLVATGEEKEPKPVLAKDDIPRFIQTFPEMSVELERLGHRFSKMEDFATFKDYEALAAAEGLLKKHGWDLETFAPKMLAIVMGFTGINIEKQLEQLPPEHRAMARSMMGGQMPSLEVHPKDRELIQQHMPRLQAFFETLK